MEIQATLTRTKYAKLLVILMSRRFSMIMAGAIFFILLVFSAFFNTGLYLAAIYLLVLVLLYGSAIFYATRKSSNKHYFMTKQYQFNNKGVFVKTPVGDQQLNWEEFINWKKLSEFFVLYVSNHTFIVIPQSSIPSKNTGEFVMLLRNKIKYKRT